jgi:hypothetical protein
MAKMDEDPPLSTMRDQLFTAMIGHVFDVLRKAGVPEE